MIDIVFFYILLSILLTIIIMQTPTIQSKEVLQKGKFLSLSRLTLAHPDGRTTPYEVVERNAEKVF